MYSHLHSTHCCLYMNNNRGRKQISLFTTTQHASWKPLSKHSFLWSENDTVSHLPPYACSLMLAPHLCGNMVITHSLCPTVADEMNYHTLDTHSASLHESASTLLPSFPLLMHSPSLLLLSLRLYSGSTVGAASWKIGRHNTLYTSQRNEVGSKMFNRN